MFIEASAKTRVYVDEIFYEMIRLINKVYPPPVPKKKKGICAIL
jgi:CRISPR/Cas system-associated exonuclease Cas4 (RecB family)